MTVALIVCAIVLTALLLPIVTIFACAYRDDHWEDDE
jgi:hypothetical protein